MATERHYSPIDRILLQADAAMKTLLPVSAHAHRPSPAIVQPDVKMNESDTRHVAGLMRINHTGEVCAQALYQGQALTAKLPQVRKAMEHAAEEEIDHLVWCEQRIHQLGSHTSVLNPLFYGASFGIGAVAGLISDRISLGFVAATEDQVCKHLNEHLEQLPVEDEKRDRGRRFPLPGAGEIRHEPDRQSHDQDHLQDLIGSAATGFSYGAR
jgi:ubiquinone biosynthesis monooxygenase Coq7